MDVFQEACMFSYENFVESLPEKVPKHKFSKAHNEKIRKLFEKEKKDKAVKFTRVSIKYILIAIILLSFSFSSVAIPSGGRYTLKRDYEYACYIAEHSGGYGRDVKSGKLNYIPEGFAKNEGIINSAVCIFRYENGDKWFTGTKFNISFEIEFWIKDNQYETFDINGSEALFYKGRGSVRGVIYNNGLYIYCVDGNIEKDELVKIAENFI